MKLNLGRAIYLFLVSFKNNFNIYLGAIGFSVNFITAELKTVKFLYTST